MPLQDNINHIQRVHLTLKVLSRFEADDILKLILLFFQRK